jgi:hypothetical protein
MYWRARNAFDIFRPGARGTKRGDENNFQINLLTRKEHRVSRQGDNVKNRRKVAEKE